MTKNTTPIRCIRKYKKKDGSFSYHAEVRRRFLPPLRKSFSNLTQAKNWVRATEKKLLEGQLPQSEKARKYTLSELLDRYESIQLQQFPERAESNPSFKLVEKTLRTQIADRYYCIHSIRS